MKLNSEEIEEYIEKFNEIKAKVQSNQKYAADILNLCFQTNDDDLLNRAWDNIVYGSDIQHYLVNECSKLTQMGDLGLGGIIIALKKVETGSDMYYWRDAYGNFSTLSAPDLDTLVDTLIEILEDSL